MKKRLKKWGENLIVFVFALLLLFAMVAIPAAIDTLHERGKKGPDLCTYTAANGTKYQDLCPEETPGIPPG